MYRIDLGSTVKDLITGFEGKVIGRCEYITGCDQYLIQPNCEDTSVKKDPLWFDDNRLEINEFVEKLELPEFEKPGADIEAPIK